MKALVKVNGNSVGIFYQITPEESQSEINFRILNIITKRYGFCDLTIQWLNN